MGIDQQILQQLKQLSRSKTLIIGVGNTLKGDDAAGPVVCEQLAGKISAEIIDTGTVPENYIQTIVRKDPQNLLIIDAVDFNASPGTIEIFRPEQLSSFAFSTHTLSPRLFIDMIKQQIKVDVYLLGIQPAQTQLGQNISNSVSEAIQQVTDVLVELFPLVE